MKVIIMRGVPGSGKSTWAANLAIKYDAVICSADHFFVNEKGEYKWDPKKLDAAHEACKRKAEKMLASGKSVVIDNTNIKKRMYRAYIYLADLFNAEVILAERRVDFRVAAKHGKHNVPFRQVEKMHLGFEEDHEFPKEVYDQKDYRS